MTLFYRNGSGVVLTPSMAADHSTVGEPATKMEGSTKLETPWLHGLCLSALLTMFMALQARPDQRSISALLRRDLNCLSRRSADSPATTALHLQPTWQDSVTCRTERPRVGSFEHLCVTDNVYSTVMRCLLVLDRYMRATAYDAAESDTTRSI